MNMKRTILLCATLGAFSAQAQTNAAGPPQAQVIVIHSDTTKDAFMEVDGRLYNTGRSALWRDLLGEVIECRSNVLVVRTFALKNIYGPVPPATVPPNIGSALAQVPEFAPVRPVVGQKKKYGEVVAIRNFPDAASVTLGQNISCRAMIVGTYSWQDSVIELYDRGLPHAAPGAGTNLPFQPVNPADKKR
jgi:hypothetical protein